MESKSVPPTGAGTTSSYTQVNRRMWAMKCTYIRVSTNLKNEKDSSVYSDKYYLYTLSESVWRNFHNFEIQQRRSYGYKSISV